MKNLNEVSYTNRANQLIVATYEFKTFKHERFKGDKTLITGKINNMSFPPFYAEGHICENVVKKHIAIMRRDRNYLKNA